MGHETGEEDAWSPACPTVSGRLRGGRGRAPVPGVAALWGLVMVGGGRQEGPTRRQRWATARAQEAVGADWGEPLRPHVLQEAADARGNGQRPGCPGVARALCDAAGHGPLCALCQAVSGEGDPGEGGGAGGKDLWAGAGRLTRG